MQNYLAFSRITGNSKQDFHVHEKVKIRIPRGRKMDLYQESRITEK